MHKLRQRTAFAVQRVFMDAQLRARVLAEWRGLPQGPSRPDRAQPVSEAIDRLMKTLGLTQRLTENEVLRAWHEIVGDFIAKHSCPSGLKNGTLFVQVLQPTVHYELDRIWKQQIVRKLSDRFGAGVVKEIRFCLG